MYTIGLEADTQSYYSGITIMISLPTGTKLLNYIYTQVGETIGTSVSSVYLYHTLVEVMITMGGSTGIVLGNAAMDVSLHDTYYVVSHFHFILSLGTMVSILLGVLHSQEYLVIGIPPTLALVTLLYYTSLCMGVSMTFLPLH